MKDGELKRRKTPTEYEKEDRELSALEQYKCPHTWLPRRRCSSRVRGSDTRAHSSLATLISRLKGALHAKRRDSAHATAEQSDLVQS